MTISFDWTAASAAVGIFLVIVIAIILVIFSITQFIHMKSDERRVLFVVAGILIAIFLVGGFIGV